MMGFEVVRLILMCWMSMGLFCWLCVGYVWELGFLNVMSVIV